MGARIDDAKRAQYALYRYQMAMPRLRAAKMAGVSNAWAVGFDRELEDDPLELERLLDAHPNGDGSIRDPIPFDELTPLARALLDDFEQWRVKVMGRTCRPWAVDAAHELAERFVSEDREFVVLNAPPGTGKALALDTPILTPTGWKTMGSLKVGDQVFDDRGLPCNVVAKSEVFTDHDCFTVTTDDGASVVADADHLWPVRLEGAGTYGHKVKPDYPGKTGPKPQSLDGIRLRSTRSLCGRRAKRPQLRVAQAIDMPEADLLVDPYVLGVWLGDGSKDMARIACHEADQPHTRARFELAGYPTTDLSKAPSFGVLGLVGQLRALGVLGNKHVPEAYMMASPKQRLALLQGLIDTDGYVAPGGLVEFCNTNERLANAVVLLARSLGVKASIRQSRATLNGVDCGPKWRVLFMMKDAASLPRKADRTRDGVRTPSRYLTVTPSPTVPTQCIQVDSPSRCFLAGEGLMVTHNSTLLADIGLWLTCKHRDLRGVAGSIKSGLSERYTRRLRTEFERDTPLKAGSTAKDKRGALDAEFTMSQLYGRFRPLKPLVWRADGFIVECEDMASRTEKEFTWLAASMEEDFIGDRVNLQLWDDPASKQSSRSPEVRHRHFEQWGVIEDRLEPGGLLVLSMQRLTINDLSRHALDKRVTLEIDLPDGDVEFEERQKYHHIVFRAHDEEKCKGVHGKGAPAWPDGCLLDPTGLPWRDLQGKMANRSEYLLTYQQDDSADPDATFKRIWIDGGREADTGILWHGCWDHQRDPGQLVRFERFLSYAAVDPSAAGWWIVQWWLYDRVSEQRVLVDMHRAKMGANDLLDFDIETQQYRGIMEDWQRRSVEFGQRIRFWVLEHNSQQRWLSQYDWARRWYQTRGVVVIGHQTLSGSKLDDKLGPEGSLPSLLQAGKIRLPGSPNGRLLMRPLVDELVHWGSHPTNDCVMAMWMAEFNLSTMLKQPDKEDWDPPTAWRPSWMKRAGVTGQRKRADLLMARLSGYREP